MNDSIRGGISFNAKTQRTQRSAEFLNETSRRILGCAVTVHRALGPGLLESAYQRCLTYELRESGLRVQPQVPMPIRYRDVMFEEAYSVDLLVENEVIVELKAVQTILPVHEAQLLTYLKLSKRHLGLLLNFNVPLLRDGITRLVRAFPTSA